MNTSSLYRPRRMRTLLISRHPYLKNREQLWQSNRCLNQQRKGIMPSSSCGYLFLSLNSRMPYPYIVALDGTRLFSISQSSRIRRSALVSRSPTRMYWRTCPLPLSNLDDNTFIIQRISTSTILTLPMR